MGAPNFLLSLPSNPPHPRVFKVNCKVSEANSNTRKNLPPGPRKLPLIGNLHNLAGSLPHHALRNLAREYGPLMHLQLGEVGAVIVSSPRMAEEVMKTHDLVFAQRPELLAAKIMSYDGLDLVFANGDYWKQMRKVCITELLGAKRVQSFASLRQEEVSNLVESIRLSPGLPINFTEKIFWVTSNIVSRSAFGNQCEDQDLFIELTKELTAMAAGFDLADLFPSQEFLKVISGVKPKLEKMHMQLDKILEKIVNQHKEKLMSTDGELEKEDLVDVLLRLQRSGSLECPIATKNIKAVIWVSASAILFRQKLVFPTFLQN